MTEIISISYLIVGVLGCIGLFGVADGFRALASAINVHTLTVLSNEDETRAKDVEAKQ